MSLTSLSLGLHSWKMGQIMPTSEGCHRKMIKPPCAKCLEPQAIQVLSWAGLPELRASPHLISQKHPVPEKVPKLTWVSGLRWAYLC